MSRWWSCLVTVALATAMHLDWHAARPAHHALSLGLSWHWLLAIPVFGLVAWYVHRARPEHPLAMSVSVIGIASLLAAVVEPAYEYFLDDAPYQWAFGPARLGSFALFLALGVAAYTVTLVLLRRREHT